MRIKIIFSFSSYKLFSFAVKRLKKSVFFFLANHCHELSLFYAPLCSRCSSLGLFHPSLTLCRNLLCLSFLTFDYDKFRETLKRTRLLALRVSTSRTNAVQFYSFVVYKIQKYGRSCVALMIKGNFSSILLWNTLSCQRILVSDERCDSI